MSFKFFRKRQKLIFVIMVLLMVSFLIGFQGFNTWITARRGSEVIGKTSEFKVKSKDYQAAKNDLTILNRIAPGFRPARAFDSELAYQILFKGDGRGQDARLAYAILLKEAQEGDFFVAEQEVEQLIQRMTANGFDYHALALDMRSEMKIPEKDIRGVLARWLLVMKSYQANAVATPPSRRELMQMYRDMSESIQLETLRVPAKTFLKDAKEPTEEEIAANFEKYRNRPAGSPAGVEDFPFGYLNPAKVKVAWLVVNVNALQAVVEPTLEQCQIYYKNNKDSLVSAATQPVKLAFSEAYPVIRQRLKAQAVKDARDQLNSTVQQKLDLLNEPADAAADAPASAPVKASPYPTVVRQMTQPADDLLARAIPIANIKDKPLSEAIAALAGLSEPPLMGIAFPMGQFGELKIDAEQKVSLQGQGLTVAEALDAIARQIKGLPKLSWSRLSGLDEALFCSGGVDFFPVMAGQTDWMTARQMQQDELLGNAMLIDSARRGVDRLSTLAFDAPPVSPKGNIQIGMDNLPMSIFSGPIIGELTWRLMDIAPTQAPESLTPELRKKVVENCKLQQALVLAKEELKDITTAKAFDDYLKTQPELKPVETALFSRVTISDGFTPTQLRSLGLSPVLSKFVINEAFENLAPENLEKEYPKASENAIVLSLPAELSILLARRTDFRPALLSGYEGMRDRLADALVSNQLLLGLQDWFLLDKIEERVGFELEDQE